MIDVTTQSSRPPYFLPAGCDGCGRELRGPSVAAGAAGRPQGAPPVVQAGRHLPPAPARAIPGMLISPNGGFILDPLCGDENGFQIMLFFLTGALQLLVPLFFKLCCNSFAEYTNRPCPPPFGCDITRSVVIN